jgi:pimeloyl-ACP methyl ester carboxylesterase
MFGVVTAAALAARLTPPPMLKGALSRTMPVPDVDHPMGRWAAAELTMTDPRMLVEAMRTVGRFTSHAWIGGVDVPAAVVVTRHDQLVPARRQYKLAEAIPGATVHEVDGDHFVCGLAPSRFVPVLVRACTDVASRGAGDD